MSGINTPEACKHWAKSGRDEIDYLKALGFVSIAEDKKNISLSTDEEGNDEIILTPKSARWVARMLKLMADEIEK